jgi:hypothetical protein
MSPTIKKEHSMRNGKIAKLNRNIREQLNLRLHNGEDGPNLLQWLNTLPEVKQTLAFHFNGAPVTKQNLSEWRLGGFRQWELQSDWVHQACELRDYTNDMQAEVLDPELLAGSLIALVSVRYAALLNSWDGEPSPEFEQKRRLLRDMARDAALIQRTSRLAALQKAESEQRQKDDRQKHKDQLRQTVLSPVLARMEQDSVEKMLALFVDAKTARSLAEFVADLEYDIHRKKKAKQAAASPLAAPEPGEGGTELNAEELHRTPLAAPEPGEGGSNPVAPSQTTIEDTSAMKTAPSSPQPAEEVQSAIRNPQSAIQ